MELILSGSPRIVNVQVMPQIESNSIRVLTELEAMNEAWDGKLSNADQGIHGTSIVVEPEGILL